MKTFDGTRWKSDRLDSIPEDFGAKGDGVTDDTAAIQAWLDSPISQKRLPSKTYLISQVTTNSNNVNVFGYGGVLKGSEVDSVMVSFTGSNISVENIVIDGDNKARVGLAVSGDGARPVIRNNTIKNFRSETNNSIALSIRNQLDGMTIVGNLISNVYSKANNVTGDNIGAARAITVALYSNDPNYGKPCRVISTISDNTIDNIYGEEGDCIHISMTDSKLVVSRNVITNFSRRGIKIQSGGTTVMFNKLYSNAIEKGYEIPINSIDSQYGSNNSIIGNQSEVIGFDRNISVAGTTDQTENVVVKDNITIGGSNSCGSVKNVTFTGNKVYSSDQAQLLQMTSTPNAVISDNAFYETGTGNTGYFILLNGTSDKSVIKQNTFVSGAKPWLIRSTSNNCFLVDNVKLSAETSSGPIYDTGTGNIKENNRF